MMRTFPSLLGIGIGPRLGVATIAVVCVWLMVMWAS